MTSIMLVCQDGCDCAHLSVQAAFASVVDDFLKSLQAGAEEEEAPPAEEPGECSAARAASARAAHAGGQGKGCPSALDEPLACALGHPRGRRAAPAVPYPGGHEMARCACFGLFVWTRCLERLRFHARGTRRKPRH